MAHATEKCDVERDMQLLRDLRASMSPRMPSPIRCAAAAADDTAPSSGAKVVYFIRHGEGTHNLAQREWRSSPDWDGKSEPYTIDQDPDMRYVDAELNDTGKGQVTAATTVNNTVDNLCGELNCHESPSDESQAVELQSRTAPLRPDLLVVREKKIKKLRATSF